MLRRLACLTLLIAGPALAAAADGPAGTRQVIDYDGGRFVIAASQQRACLIALRGLITRDATFKFDAVLARTAELGCDRPWLMLESPGGALGDGIALGREVHFRQLRTITHADCASACALIFLGGSERVLVGARGRIGLHQPATTRFIGNDRHCGGSLDSNGVRDIRSYLRWVVPARADELMKLVLRTSCDAIEWIDGARALELGIATRLADDADAASSRTQGNP
jgi:hypothetical protein